MGDPLDKSNTEGLSSVPIAMDTFLENPYENAAPPISTTVLGIYNIYDPLYFS